MKLQAEMIVFNKTETSIDLCRSLTSAKIPVIKLKKSSLENSEM